MNSRIREAESQTSLDSFMDIITNVIGALFFVLVFAALASFGARGKVTLPLARTVDTEPAYFECRANTAFRSGIEQIQERAVEMITALPEDQKTIQGVRDAAEAHDLGNEFYTWRLDFQFSGGSGLVPCQILEMVPDARGETGPELAAEQSRFRQDLEQIDPEEQHIFFIVRNDSFEVFHTARRAAVEAGFNVGWMPFDAEGAIVIGPEGESTNVIQ